MAVATVVGLDIGTQQIKAVELNASGKEGLTITGLTVSPTPPGLIQNNILTDPAMMGGVIKQVLKDAGISKTKKVVGCVAGQSAVVVRIIEVPKMTPQELVETMKWEVERHVPFAPNEVEMDYQVLPVQDTSESNPNMSVLLAVAQQDLITTYVDMLFAANLDPIAIDIESLAAGRALLDIDQSRPVVRPLPKPGDAYDLSSFNAAHETVAVINIGASNTDVSIFEDGQLIFPRALPIAGDSLTRAISEALGYTLEQAERIKREHGSVIVERMVDHGGATFGMQDQPQIDFRYSPDEDMSNWRPSMLPTDEEETAETTAPNADEEGVDRTQPISQRSLDLSQPVHGGETSSSAFGAQGEMDSLKVQVFDAMAPILSEMATELRRSLEYHRSRTRGRGVDRVLLCGGCASLPGLDRFLSHDLQVPVVVADPFGNVSVSTKQFDPSYLRTIAPIFAVAVGLAAREAIIAANPPVPDMKKMAGRSAGPPSAGGGKFSLPSFGKKKSDTTTLPTVDRTIPPQ